MAENSPEELQFITYSDFDIFDDNIPINKVREILAFRTKQRKPAEGKVSIYKPKEAFERLFRQAVDTTRNLVNFAEILKVEMKAIPEKHRDAFVQFVNLQYRILGKNTELLLGDFLKDPENVDFEEKVPFLKCIDILNHIWGTSAALLLANNIEYDIYAMHSFNEYLLKASLSLYNNNHVVPMYAIRGQVAKTFIEFIHSGVLDKNLLNDETLDLPKCIELFVNQDLSKISNINELEMNVLYVRNVITLPHEFHDSEKTSMINIVVQTLIWFWLWNSAPEKLLRFKTEEITLRAIMDCYSETVLENINNFVKLSSIEP